MQHSVRWGLILLLLAGCGTDELSDTAGSSAPPAGPPVPSALQLDSVPMFAVTGGLFQGDSIHFFGVFTASYLASGHAAVVLGRNQNQIALLDEGGQVVQVMGGRGDGPKEFRNAPTLIRAGHELFAFTNRSYVEVRIDGLGTPFPYQQPEIRQQALGMYANRTFVTTPHPALRWNSREGFSTGLESTPYYFWSGGVVVDSLAGPASPPAPGYWLGSQPYLAVGECKPELHHIVADSVLVIAQADTGLLLALHRSGDLDTLYSSHDRSIVTQEMVDGARRVAKVASLESDAPFLEEVGKPGDPLESVWSHMLFDGARLVWLRRAPTCFFPEPPVYRWDVIDINARERVAVVELPAAQQLIAVSPSIVLSLSRDELDVERLSAFRIIR